MNLAHKALLFLDNCSGQPTNQNDLQESRPRQGHLSAAKDNFPHPAYGSRIQDVMCYFKAKYLELTSAELPRDDEFGVSQFCRQFNIMDCIGFIGRSWKSTTQACLNHGWKLWHEVVADFKGFKSQDMVQAVVAAAHSLPSVTMLVIQYN